MCIINLKRKTMKKILLYILIPVLFSVISSCNLDFVNPNAATQEQVYNTKDGLFGLAIGIQKVYATDALGTAINTVAVTTKEAAGVTTYSSLEDLEKGSLELAGDNERISRLFARTHRAKGMAEDLLANVETVDISEPTKAGLAGLANLYRAMSLGLLIQNWEKAIVENDKNGTGNFSDRSVVLNDAIEMLKAAKTRVGTSGVSAEFQSAFMPQDELLNKINAYLARFELLAGNYQNAINAANAVDKTKAYFFKYDTENQNPVNLQFHVGLVEIAPIDNFGLPSTLVIDPTDKRIGFYFEASDKNSLFGMPIEKLIAPFFNAPDAKIPFYYPGELDLIVAEANARLGKISDAETALNKVRFRTAAEDVLGYGLAAGLTDKFSSGGDQQKLLNEIYINRRIEMYLSGMSLEDSRRFNRPQPSTTVIFNTERNRNFYPYPLAERSKNTNTPTDPNI
jgi:hypothetical protein